MKPIIDPIPSDVLIKELKPEYIMRPTNNGGNVLYVITAKECPNVMLEIGRLREEAFRVPGGGTGKEADIDEDDMAEEGYKQLIVWDPVAGQIVGGYRYIISSSRHPKHFSTEHYFTFSDKFRRKYLPYTIELGRSFVQVDYQDKRKNPKGIYAMDNLWDGLGALMHMNPRSKYFFGKVTMYDDYNREARDILLYFLGRYFPDKEGLALPINPIELSIDEAAMQALFSGADYKENYKILVQKLRSLGEFVPPMINSYMSVSPSMKVFDTVRNLDFGCVEETGILITFKDIYPHKIERHMSGLDRIITRVKGKIERRQATRLAKRIHKEQ